MSRVCEDNGSIGKIYGYSAMCPLLKLIGIVEDIMVLKTKANPDTLKLHGGKKTTGLGQLFQCKPTAG